MDFFSAQAHAKRRTARLVWLFALAVLGTVAAAYFAAVFALGFTGRSAAPTYHRETRNGVSVRVRDSAPASRAHSLWQPRVLFWTASGVLAVVGLASLYKWHEFSAGGSAVAESVGARRVDPHTTDTLERRLLNVVEEMAIASGTPVPAVFLLDDEPAINAFAAGLSTADAAVCVTRGTMEKLTRDELQGVVGHEFSHILNGDMRLNLRIAAIVFGILVLGLAGRGLLWSLRFQNFSGGGDSRDRDDGDNRGGKNSNGLVIALAVAGVALLIIGYVGYFFGRLIQSAVSRQREFLADASAVQFTRNPGGLTGALKKIGGYALGSSLQTPKAGAIGHFFFAQAFTSGLDSLFATHPPLDTRIRAIDPKFDGEMFEPPQPVDITRESFQTAGFAGPQAAAAHPPRAPFASTPAAAIDAIGTLTPAQIDHAAALLHAVPAALRDATRDPARAAALCYGLLLDGPPEVRAQQHALVAAHAGDAAADALAELRPVLSLLDPAARLPLLQLCVPALRTLDGPALDRFGGAVFALINADGVVTPFEFALQKILLRSVARGRAQAAAVVQVYSFNAVVDEISTVLSALAHASSPDVAAAQHAFARGAAQIKLIETRLAFHSTPAADLAPFDAALDRLAAASLPIKQRTLVAAAHVVAADGQILLAEGELLRAIAAALDVPMPPLATAA
ncbi:MAG: hypothetical protein RLZZ15_3997 [Verrucomicrobiota bacterium]|jgi:Zn-dependent protease with chaperone function